MTLRILLWIALAVAASGFQAPVDREADVYRIYSILMSHPGTSRGADQNPRYLIAAQTRNSGLGEPCVTPPNSRAAEFSEVMQDYRDRQPGSRTLVRKLSIAKPYELLTEYEVKAFQQWREPRPNPQPKPSDGRFEGVSDVYSLADVYFSKNGRLALTAVASWCGGLCGQHQWKVLEKAADGQWRELPWVTCFTIARASR